MRVLAVFEKEMLEALKNRLLLFTLIPMPLFFVAMPLGILVFSDARPVEPEQIEMYSRLSPAYATMDPTLVFQIVLVSQFMVLLLMTPVIVPLTIATYSIIGEKQSRSLEPLLATPIRTWELLLGKSLAAVVPAIVVTWASYAVLLGGMAILAKPLVLASMASGMWLLAIGIIAPLLAILAVNLGVLISSRVNDTRVAQQIGGLVVLPLVGIAIAQTTGRLLYSMAMFVAGAAIIAILDAGVLMAAVKLFQRETILTRWK